MEMEHINDNLIKVIIKTEDLLDRGINFLDLIGDQAQIEKFFYSILEEVDVDRHFNDSDAVTFQVIPNSQGLELYISRANVEDLDKVWDDELSRRLGARQERLHKEGQEETEDLMEAPNSYVDKRILQQILEAIPSKSANESDEVTPEDETIEYEVVQFSSLEDFLKLARELPLTEVESDLYHMGDNYYLVLYGLEEFVKDESQANRLLNLFEYGEAVYVTIAVLQEHGQMIRSEDALAFFGKQL